MTHNIRVYNIHTGESYVRQATEEEHAEFLEEIRAFLRRHPPERCDLFKTKFGRCTCDQYEKARWEWEGGHGDD